MTSGISLHFEKHKGGPGVNGLQRHNERKPGGRHSNKNIDDTRTAQNVFLSDLDGTYTERIQNIITERRAGGLRGVRKDAVRMVSATVQISDDITRMSDEKQEAVMRDAYEYLADTFGRENIVSAVVHKDETSQHLHFDFVPMSGSKLSAKEVLSRSNLQRYQRESLQFLQNRHQDADFQRKKGKVNGLKQRDFEVLKDEEARIKAKADALDVRAKTVETGERAFTLVAEAYKEQQAVLQQEREEFERQKIALEAKKTALEAREAEIDEKYRKGSKFLTDAKKYTSQAYKQKKAMDKAFCDEFGEYSEKMRILRERQDSLWNSPERREKWDSVALKLKNARDMEYQTRGGGSWISAIFNIIATVQKEKYERQLQVMDNARKEVMNEVKAERKSLRDSLSEARAERDAARKSASEWTQVRNKAQKEVNALNEQKTALRGKFSEISKDMEHNKQSLLRMAEGLEVSLIQQNADILGGKISPVIAKQVNDERLRTLEDIKRDTSVLSLDLDGIDENLRK